MSNLHTARDLSAEIQRRGPALDVLHRRRIFKSNATFLHDDGHVIIKLFQVWSLEEELHTLERDESRILCFDWYRSCSSSQQSTIWIAGLVNDIITRQQFNVSYSGCEDSKVAIWKLTGSDHHRATIAKILKGNDDAIDTVAFSPDGRLLSSLDASGNVIIWFTQVSPL
jgi:WD40 repeat protein